jgi:hypothetical protein
MLAFGLSIALFVFWGLVGYAVLVALRIRYSSIRNMLLAPVVGLSITLLSVFWLSRSGLPVIGFGITLSVVLLVVSIGAVWHFHPITPLRHYLPFAGVFLLALFFTGRPLLEFGFNWLSFSNDDFANYALGAQRILNHGFFDIPDSYQLVNGLDYSLTYWFFNLGVRPASEMLNAWTSSLTKGVLLPDKIFMPLIMALHLVLISSVGALVYQTRRFRSAALMSCVMLSLSALTSLGALYQLISQVGGLALLVGCVTILLRPFDDARVPSRLRYGTLTALLVSALFIMYPEVLPFLVLAFGLYWLLGVIRQRLILRPMLITLSMAAVVTLAMLNSYTPIALVFLLQQATAGLALTNLQTMLFPYYLLPSGLANLWGFQSITGLSPEPLLSISILLGGLLLLVAVGVSFWQSWRLKPVAIMAIVMFGLGFRLFFQRSDFGLFKLAMFIQPFMLATIVIAWFELIKKPVWRVTPLLLLALAGLGVQTFYVTQSSGSLRGIGSGLIEVPGASVWKINDEYKALLEANESRAIVLDTSNIVLAKFQALYSFGREATFPTADMFYNIAGADPGIQMLNPGIPVAAQALKDARQERYTSASFDLHDEDDPTATNGLLIDKLQPPETNAESTLLIATTDRQTLLNRSIFGFNNDRDFVAIPWEQNQNHLLFISSQLGQPYYTADRTHISLHQLEPDLYFQGRTMAGIGRYFLFQTINPTVGARFVLEITATLKADGENKLPPAVAVGVDRQLFPIIGHGSARVFSPQVVPQMIQDRPYLGIDMGVNGTLFPDQRTGLMFLYGTDIIMDRRPLVAFARNISLVSDEEYSSMTPPRQVTNFPDDLANPTLEYSGLYEDGWIADSAFLQLTQPADTPAQLVVRGTVPLINDPSFSTELRVLLDGEEVARRTLTPGDFEMQVPVSSGPAQRRVDLRFSDMLKLPAPDNRPAAAQLFFVGFEDDSIASAHSQVSRDIVNPNDALVIGAGWYPLETYDGETFRWVNNDAEITVQALSETQRQLNLDIEPGPGLESKPFELQVLDPAGKILSTIEVDGRQTINISLPTLSQTSMFKLHIEGGGGITQNDPRILNFRVFQLGWSDQ